MEQPIPEFSRRYTEEEYLRFAEASGAKHEYRDGRIIPYGGWEVDAAGLIVGMAGGTFDHGVIAANLTRAIGNRLQGRPCWVVGSDVRVRLTRKATYYYPDVSVGCHAPIFIPPDRRTTVTNPQVVIEVLSPSTIAADRGEKLYDYVRIDSLHEYALVDQDVPRVVIFSRHFDGTWAIGPAVEGLDASVTFSSLGVTVPLAEVYAGVDLPPSPPPPTP